MRAVIFDCDGVLVDSEPIAGRVMAGLLTEAGLPSTYEDVMRDLRGRSMGGCMEIVRERLGREPDVDIPGRYYEAVEAAFRTDLVPVAGIVAALDRIDLPNCVASSGPHHKMRVSLGVTGLWDRFAGRIFSASEVGAGKPAPDLFLHAAGRMGFDPATTAVVEDSVPGVQAAVAAGMRALAYAAPGHSPAADLEAAGGEAFCDMAALPGLLGCA